MNKRVSKYNINNLLLNRWSPRKFSGETISQEEVMALLEAASWAPSSFNNQPWRFIYATKESKAWAQFFAWLNPGNQVWAEKAGALIVVVSANNFSYDNRPSRTHSFDAGLACENLALEATSRNLVAHMLEGFDYDKVKNELKIPDEYTVEAMIAIGRLATDSDEEPGTRKDLSEIVGENEFKFE